jgi:hypothetical protein
MVGSCNQNFCKDALGNFSAQSILYRVSISFLSFFRIFYYPCMIDLAEFEFIVLRIYSLGTWDADQQMMRSAASSLKFKLLM